MKELVIAKYLEDVRWTEDVPQDLRVTIYDKGNGQLPNVGREAHTYLHHIIERYDDLADLTFFSQGFPFDHSPDFIGRLSAAYQKPTPLSCRYKPGYPHDAIKVYDDEYEHEGFVVSLADASRFAGRPVDQNKRWLSSVWRAVFYGKAPDDWRYGYGAQWAVPREYILKSKRWDWERLHDACADGTLSGYEMEVLWPHLWKGSAQSRPGPVWGGSDYGSATWRGAEPPPHDPGTTFSMLQTPPNPNGPGTNPQTESYGRIWHDESTAGLVGEPQGTARAIFADLSVAPLAAEPTSQDRQGRIAAEMSTAALAGAATIAPRTVVVCASSPNLSAEPQGSPTLIARDRSFAALAAEPQTEDELQLPPVIVSGFVRSRPALSGRITTSPAFGGGIPHIDFNEYTILSHGYNQDARGTATIHDDGASLRLYGNNWKMIALPYAVTPDTLLEFTFQSYEQGEVAGVGFSRNPALASSTFFAVYGLQSSFGSQVYSDYAAHAPARRRYVIPVGEHFTGSFDYIVFANDQDRRGEDGEAVYSRLKLYERGQAGEPPVLLRPTRISSYPALRGTVSTASALSGRLTSDV